MEWKFLTTPKELVYVLTGQKQELDTSSLKSIAYVLLPHLAAVRMDGWKVTLAGPRFTKPAESRYAPVEGEALAIQWALDQTKFFTLGCRNLLVVTDHKPLLKLFGDRTLDEIENPRLFAIKQKTLLWRFDIEYMPGKQNLGADAFSRNPVEDCDYEEVLSISMTESLAGIRVQDNNYPTTIAANWDENQISAITWDRVKDETKTDEGNQNR